MKSGIYQIKNTQNGKVYIGSSTDIPKRWRQHLQLLKSGNHHSIHLQRSWNKHFVTDFEFSILEECDKKNLLTKENKWLNQILKADDYKLGKSDYFLKAGYNICPIAQKGHSGFQTEESILKQLNSRKIFGVYQVNRDGIVIGFYRIIKNCPDSPRVVRRSARNRSFVRDKDYGYIDANLYEQGYKPKIKSRVSTTKIAWNKGQFCPTNKGTKVFVYDIYGRFYSEFPAIVSANRHFKLSEKSTAIERKMNKKSLQLSGRTSVIYYNFFTSPQKYNTLCSFSNEGNIVVKTVFNEFLGFSSVKELVEKLNVTNVAVYSVLNKKRKQLKGYLLEYRNDIV
jgi:group I intron endonuclease